MLSAHESPPWRKRDDTVNTSAEPPGVALPFFRPGTSRRRFAARFRSFALLSPARIATMTAFFFLGIPAVRLTFERQPLKAEESA